MTDRITISDDTIVRDLAHARELLAQDSPSGCDAMPCSRYGRYLSDAYDVVYWAAVVLQACTEGNPVSWRDLDSIAGLVVNDHPDPAYLLVSYGYDLPVDVADLIEADAFPEVASQD